MRIAPDRQLHIAIKANDTNACSRFNNRVNRIARTMTRQSIKNDQVDSLAALMNLGRFHTWRMRCEL